MAQPQTAAEPAVSEETQGGTDSKREVSKIGFPYDDLDGAAQIAKAIHELNGSACEVEQIAGHLNQSPKSSTFKMQIASAKTFGLVTGSQGVITLTKLGTQICDSQQEKPARAEAFLAVELYKAIYDKFKGAQLPPDKGLEAAIVSLGVAQKQKERARQIFKRAAQQAGFFQFGTDRLVLPAIKAGAASSTLTPESESKEPEPSEETDKRRRGKDSGGGEYHPFIEGLLKKLPAPDSDWPMEGRAKWLQTAANIFDLMYTDSEDSKRIINVAFQKDSAK